MQPVEALNIRSTCKAEVCWEERSGGGAGQPATVTEMIRSAKIIIIRKREYWKERDLPLKKTQTITIFFWDHMGYSKILVSNIT